MNLLTIAALAAAASVLAAAWVGQRHARRARVLRSILDRADAFEQALHDCRQRLLDVPALLAPVAGPSGPAGGTPDAAIEAALRDLLAHRLWLKDKAASAPQADLEAADAALARSLADLQRQIGQLDQAQAQLRQAIDATATDRPA